nr:MAG TPA_asm: hypothetical protein [Caudoviricetes sp.]DAL67189.1 MAG TPA: hypothetical protein [Caudoviricetes sp.]DAR98998.1 MAG TPA: hypothetical protein [Caudoviricetes sp.]DAT73727.1 MAG TPA: hypothetical protein [Caudoviricetes sp.]DAV04925.1 MAG TPA: hypothetical protein [Caudoviricetes sp.]
MLFPALLYSKRLQAGVSAPAWGGRKMFLLCIDVKEH